MRERRRSETAAESDMAVKGFIVLAAIAVSSLLGAAPAMAGDGDAREAKSHAASASEVSAQTKRRRPRLRIQVTPGRLLYRQCSAWYAVEYRFSGPTMVPRMRCWWVRG
jgi:hypothetical protein